MKLERDIAPGVHQVAHDFVNFFLVEDEGKVTVVDAGVPASWRSLEQALTTIGRRIEDIEAHVITHGHFDHVGFTSVLVERGVPTYLHETDLPQSRHPKPFLYRSERPGVLYALRPGVPRILGQLIAGGALKTRPFTPTHGLADGEVLDVPGHPAVVTCPGHTLGHVAFHLPERGCLLAGDAFVTLDPYTGRRGPRPVAKAATHDSTKMWESLTKLSHLPDAQVCGIGHGPAWTGGIAQAVELARDAGQA